MTTKDEQLRSILAEHDREIGSINSKINDLSNSVGHITEKLDTVLSAVTSITSRPSWSLRDSLDATLKLFALIAGTVGFVTFVAGERFSATVAEGTAALKESRVRIERLEDWREKDMQRRIDDLLKFKETEK